jgi:hypothetical protein
MLPLLLLPAVVLLALLAPFTTGAAVAEPAAAAAAAAAADDNRPPAFHYIPLQRGAMGRLGPLLLAEREEGQRLAAPGLSDLGLGGPPTTTPSLRGSSYSSSSSSSRRRREGGGDGDKGMDVVGGSEAVFRPLTTLDPRLTAYFVRVGFGGGQASERVGRGGVDGLI